VRGLKVYATEEVVEILSIGTPGATNTAVTVRRGVGLHHSDSSSEISQREPIVAIGEAAEEAVEVHSRLAEPCAWLTTTFRI